MKTITLAAFAAALFLGTVPVWAHHAFAAEFDATKPVKLQGIVVKVDLVNPHSWIHVAVKNEDGTTTEWMVEGGSPNALARHGFTKKTLPKGTEVIFEGFRAKDGSNRANGRDIMLTDGKKISLGSSAGETAPETKGK